MPRIAVMRAITASTFVLGWRAGVGAGVAAAVWVRSAPHDRQYRSPSTASAPQFPQYTRAGAYNEPPPRRARGTGAREADRLPRPGGEGARDAGHEGAHGLRPFGVEGDLELARPHRAVAERRVDGHRTAPAGNALADHDAVE